MVKEHRSWLKIMDRHESCVESFSGPDYSTRRQSSLFDQDTSGRLSTVLSKVNASDFPRLDFESEQSRAGTAESWMQMMGLKMSAVSPASPLSVTS